MPSTSGQSTLSGPLFPAFLWGLLLMIGSVRVTQVESQWAAWLHRVPSSRESRSVAFSSQMSFLESPWPRSHISPGRCAGWGYPFHFEGQWLCILDPCQASGHIRTCIRSCCKSCKRPSPATACFTERTWVRDECFWVVLGGAASPQPWLPLL